MLPTKEIGRATARRFEAYESGDLARILDIYTDDAVYWDTKAGKGIKGKADLTRHFADFFGRFHTRFAVLEEHRLEGQDAAIVLWQCAVRRRMPDGALGEQIVMQRGMNLCALRGDRVCRDESYMDLASLEALFESAAA
ncbi:Ketosteroid isomerase-related protein (plasmid) [Variovorax sp. SRS16]|uniref:nuclear transport factor 2 family protein n=1 Tax=Variovorax sp. SRS16 TaxID=282217 RepID=UPI001315E788|nr:nuclear transport factor 2 family protein [Variovorax sp. SRS16]VTU45543.1 Ketosteroid isomerase-related protein [Variovorax sp. SRS16]